MKDSRPEFLAGIGSLVAFAMIRTAIPNGSRHQIRLLSARLFFLRKAISRFLNRSHSLIPLLPIRSRMIKKLQEEIPRLGFEQLTPSESTSALLCFGLKKKNSQSILDRLRERKVHVRVDPNQLRVSPSVFNDRDDIDKLLEALS